MPWAPLSLQCSQEACAEETHTPLPPHLYIAVLPGCSNAKFSLQLAGALLRPPHCF